MQEGARLATATAQLFAAPAEMRRYRVGLLVTVNYNIIIVANFSKTNELETRAARQRSAYLAYKWVYFGTKCDSWIFIDIVMIISSGVSESKGWRYMRWRAARPEPRGSSPLASISIALLCAWVPYIFDGTDHVI